MATDPTPPSLLDVAGHMKRLDPAYSFDDGVLQHAGTPIAQLELNKRGEDLFEQERTELIEFATDASGPGKQRVLTLLNDARWVLAAQVVFDGPDAQSALTKLEPIWRWLLKDYRGLLQADGEGYRDATGIILADE